MASSSRESSETDYSFRLPTNVDTRGEVRLVSCLYVAVLLSEYIFASGDERHNLRHGFHAPLYGGRPDTEWKQMETPQYADINDTELREIEAELGHPVTRELAQWFIRNRINREAVERMLAVGTQPELPQKQTMFAIAR